MDAQPQSATPTPHIGALTSARSIRQEMGRVYRECRLGKLDTKNGARLIFMLLSMFRVVEGSILEERLDVIEQRLGEADEREKQAGFTH